MVVVFATSFFLLILWLCFWAFYKVVVYALPVIAGWYAAHLAADTGAGFWGAGVVFLIVSLAVYTVGRVLYAELTWPPARFALSATYCIPAGLVAFFAVEDLSNISGSTGRMQSGSLLSEVWPRWSPLE